MRKTLFFACMLAMALSAFSQDYLKLMSYNVRNTKGMDGVRDYQRIANVIINESPDVVAIQELDSMTTRSEQKYVLGELAERTQMHGNYVPAISFQGGKYGIGILMRIITGQCIIIQTHHLFLPGAMPAEIPKSRKCQGVRCYIYVVLVQ